MRKATFLLAASAALLALSAQARSDRAWHAFAVLEDTRGRVVGLDRVGYLYYVTDRFTLSPGPASLFDEDGSALVIHADPDDQVTDPTGNSGGRIVCGVIAPPQDGATPVATPTA